MDSRLDVHKKFLPDQAELARLEVQASHIRALHRGRTSERLSNQSHSHFIYLLAPATPGWDGVV